MSPWYDLRVKNQWSIYLFQQVEDDIRRNHTVNDTAWKRRRRRKLSPTFPVGGQWSRHVHRSRVLQDKLRCNTPGCLPCKNHPPRADRSLLFNAQSIAKVISGRPSCRKHSPFPLSLKALSASGTLISSIAIPLHMPKAPHAKKHPGVFSAICSDY